MLMVSFYFKYFIQNLLKWQRALLFLTTAQNDISIPDQPVCSQWIKHPFLCTLSERLIYLAYSACSLSSCYHCKSYTVLSLSSPGGLVPRLQLIPKSMDAQVPHVKCCPIVSSHTHGLCICGFPPSVGSTCCRLKLAESASAGHADRTC